MARGFPAIAATRDMRQKFDVRVGCFLCAVLKQQIFKGMGGVGVSLTRPSADDARHCDGELTMLMPMQTHMHMHAHEQHKQIHPPTLMHRFSRFLSPSLSPLHMYSRAVRAEAFINTRTPLTDIQCVVAYGISSSRT